MLAGHRLPQFDDSISIDPQGICMLKKGMALLKSFLLLRNLKLIRLQVFFDNGNLMITFVNEHNSS